MGNGRHQETFGAPPHQKVAHVKSLRAVDPLMYLLSSVWVPEFMEGIPHEWPHRERQSGKPPFQTRRPGQEFLSMFLPFLLRDCGRTRTSGPSWCPRFCRSQRYVMKTNPSFQGGATFREAGPGLPKRAGWKPQICTKWPQVFLHKGVLVVKTGLQFWPYSQA